jgi:hypothetical protein
MKQGAIFATCLPVVGKTDDCMMIAKQPLLKIFRLAFTRWIEPGAIPAPHQTSAGRNAWLINERIFHSWQSAFDCGFNR